MSGYTCHAHPPHLNGRECGHFNERPPTTRAFLSAGTGIYRAMRYCEACGCPKTASDHRKAAKKKRS